MKSSFAAVLRLSRRRFGISPTIFSPMASTTRLLPLAFLSCLPRFARHTPTAPLCLLHLPTVRSSLPVVSSITTAIGVVPLRFFPFRLFNPGTPVHFLLLKALIPLHSRLQKLLLHHRKVALYLQAVLLLRQVPLPMRMRTLLAPPTSLWIRTVLLLRLTLTSSVRQLLLSTRRLPIKIRNFLIRNLRQFPTTTIRNMPIRNNREVPEIRNIRI